METSVLRFFFGTVFSVVTLVLNAQQTVDFNKIIIPLSAKDVEFKEKLVQLAWLNNPANGIITREIEVAHLDTKLARRNWLNQINATGNINEFTINPPSNIDFPLFFPRYNFGVSFSIGNLFLDPVRVKKAKVGEEIARTTLDGQKLKIRAEVLRRYQTYLANVELLKVRTEALEGALTSLSLAEQKFGVSEISIDEYNRTLENYNEQKTLKILAENDMLIAKINVEEMIGLRLEDVI